MSRSALLRVPRPVFRGPRPVALALFATALAGCAGASPSEPALLSMAVDSSIRLRVGQSVEVDGDGLRVRFESVTSDSRCPIDVVCVWEGDATLRLRVVSGGAEGATFELHTSLEPRSHDTSGHRLLLESLEPIPTSGAAIPQRDYVATIRISRIASN